MSRLFCWAGSVSLCLAFSTTAQASFELISRTDGEPTVVTEPNGGVSNPSISANGRFVAFASDASNLVADDPNGKGTDIFFYDRDTDAIELLTPGGNFDSLFPSISADGRFIAFESRASNLVAGDSGVVTDIFLYDLDAGTLRSITANGNDDSRRPAISADGRFVAFESRATNLVADDTNGAFDIFVYDAVTDTLELLAQGGGQGDFDLAAPSISADGRFVAFTSDVGNLAPGDTNGQEPDVFVFDRDTDSLELISAGGNGASLRPSISADGRIVVFDSRASNLAAGDTNGGVDDVFLYDRNTNTTELLTAGGNNLSLEAEISADGRFVTFISAADNLTGGVGFFGYDRDSSTIELLSQTGARFRSMSSDGQLVAISGGSRGFIFDRATNSRVPLLTIEVASEAVGGNDASQQPSVSATGRFVAFQSSASNLVAGDTNGVADIFVRDRASQLTQLLTAGANAESSEPSISADGNIVVFTSLASNIGGVTPISRSDIFVHNLNTNTTELVTRGANNLSRAPSVSADGRFVAFESFASNLVSGDANGTSPDIFVYDRQTGVTEILTNGGNTPFLLLSAHTSISADGRFVAFQSNASNLAAGDTNGDDFDVFVHDRVTGITELVTAGGNRESTSPSISADGRFVAFTSRASNLAPGDNAVELANRGLLVHDRATDTTEVLLAGGRNFVVTPPSISADGRFVAINLESFFSNAPGVFPLETILLFDRDSDTIEELTEGADFDSVSPSISADGLTVAFGSRATNLTNDGLSSDIFDVFVATDNTAPSANSLAAVTNEDAAVAFSVTGSDPDGDTLFFNAVTLPSNGELSGTAPDFIYTPNADFFGTDSFTFAANDGSGPSVPAIVTIEVIGVNDAPVALGTDVGADLSTLEDTALAIALTGSDIDGDTLTYAITSLPNNGTLSGTAPNLTYTPAANFGGSDSFSFTVSDGALTSSPMTVNIAVASTNDVPVADSQTLATAPNTPLSIALTGSDPDGSALNFSIVGFPTNGTLVGDLPDLVYTPASDFTGVDSFTFSVSDGSAVSAAATVSITVAGLNPPPSGNNPPTANELAVSTPRDTSVSVLLTASDPEGDSLSFSFVTLPANGSLSGTAPDLIYTPDTSYTGADSFSFTVSDGQGTSAPVTVSITVVDASITLFSAVLPASRSIEVGSTATAFATLINAGSVTAQACAPRLPDTLSADFFYQTSDAASNEVVGQPNLAVDIPAGASQSFVFGITPTDELTATEVALQFQCANATEAASFVGLNTLLLSASFTPVPDLIALVATTSNNGVMELSNNSGFFTAATINVGSASTITVSADTGEVTLPVTLSLCQTDPATSVCINPAVPDTQSVIVDVAEGDSPTFAVFASATESIALNPANSRVFLRFSDELGVVRGATSVAVQNVP